VWEPSLQEESSTSYSSSSSYGWLAVVGDNTNYWIGRAIGPKVFQRERFSAAESQHLEQRIVSTSDMV